MEYYSKMNSSRKVKSKSSATADVFRALAALVSACTFTSILPGGSIDYLRGACAVRVTLSVSARSKIKNKMEKLKVDHDAVRVKMEQDDPTVKAERSASSAKSYLT